MFIAHEIDGLSFKAMAQASGAAINTLLPVGALLVVRCVLHIARGSSYKHGAAARYLLAFVTIRENQKVSCTLIWIGPPLGDFNRGKHV